MGRPFGTGSSDYSNIPGLDSQTLATRDAQDIVLINATNFVPFDKTDPKNEVYVVDFEGCLKAFL